MFWTMKKFLTFAVLALACIACKEDEDERLFFLEKDTIEFTSSGGNVSVTMTGIGEDAGVEIVSGNKDWLETSIEGRALSVTARRNISQEDRSTVLVLECAGMTASLSVVQYGRGELLNYAEMPFWANEVSVGIAGGEDEIKVETGSEWLFYRITETREIILYTEEDYLSEEDRSTNVTVSYGGNSLDIAIVQHPCLFYADIQYDMQPFVKEDRHAFIVTLQLENGAEDIRLMTFYEGDGFYDEPDEAIMELLEYAGYNYEYYQSLGFNFLFRTEPDYRIAWFVIDGEEHRSPLQNLYIKAEDWENIE